MKSRCIASVFFFCYGVLCLSATDGGGRGLGARALAVRDETRATREEIRSICFASLNYKFALQTLSARATANELPATIFSSGTFKCRLPKGTYAWCYLLFALIRYLNATGNKDQGYYRLYRLLLPALKIGLRVRRRDHFFGVQHIFVW